MENKESVLTATACLLREGGKPSSEDRAWAFIYSRYDGKIKHLYKDTPAEINLEELKDMLITFSRYESEMLDRIKEAFREHLENCARPISLST